MFRPSTPEKEEHMRRLAEEDYEKEKNNSPTIQDRSEGHFNYALLITAGVLLTYGRLDVIDHILDNLPQPNSLSRFRVIAAVVKDLLPLPQDLKPIENRELVRQWIRDHEDRLVWDDDQGRFLLVDG
jgi:hypothetical protein